MTPARVAEIQARHAVIEDRLDRLEHRLERAEKHGRLADALVRAVLRATTEGGGV